VSTLYCFTSAARNYLPKTQLLARSLRQYHPEARLVLGLADDPLEGEALAGQPWDEVLPLAHLGIPEWRRWAFMHDIVELSTAIKPFVLKGLLARPDCAGVLYFDPDIVLFSRLDDLIARLGAADVLLTPHQAAPETTPGAVIDNEICSLQHGVYNLGFVGVAASDNGRAFANWWADRCYDYCRRDIPNGLFTDQRWVDLAPALFDGVEVVRSPRFNVATWNLTTRPLAGSAAQGYRVGPEPLGFYHFTGFDSGAHGVMAGKYGAGNSAVQELVQWYERSIVTRDADPASRVPWAFATFSNGETIHRGHRVIYRVRPDLQEEFPEPFDAGAGGNSGYLGWCRRHGRRQYPDFLPMPKPYADWRVLNDPPRPALAVRGVRPARLTLRQHLRRALVDRAHADRLRAELSVLLRREGWSGIWRRMRGRL
jgi:hypothetical protein